MEDGDITSFFKDLPGLALAPKMCLDKSQAFKELNNSHAFTVLEKKKKLTIIFLYEPLPAAPRHLYKV